MLKPSTIYQQLLIKLPFKIRGK